MTDPNLSNIMERVDGNRTVVLSLEDSGPTIGRYPRKLEPTPRIGRGFVLYQRTVLPLNYVGIFSGSGCQPRTGVTALRGPGPCQLNEARSLNLGAEIRVERMPDAL